MAGASGGVAGIGAGTLSTAIYATAKHEPVVISALAWAGCTGAAILIGAVAGLWPVLRAARISPTQALWSM
jgi:putative ABC transport system permease protein